MTSFRFVIGGEHAFQAYLLRSDVLWRADSRDHRKISKHDSVDDEAHRDDRHGRRDRPAMRFPVVRRIRISEQFIEQTRGAGIDHMAHGFAIHTLQQASCDRVPIGHEWTQAFRIEHQMQHVARTFARGHVDETAEEAGRCVVGHQHVPVPVHHDRRKRVVLANNPLQRANDPMHFLRVPRRLGIHGCVARGEQQRIALAQRDIERLRERQERVTARHAAPAFDEADLALRNARFEGEIELTHATHIAPIAQ
ncbi:hypothetical protein AWB75_02263 [Caballeronia catudaia]|uniref:Uncharacterized protein n=1 Tax=Caballeronia catudaia TaxID=1777136 RepID=A0A158AL50_9BURK|nr:hypothetical protein AWB75_02263 [Caballeronia catudaia]